jgi:hypothetical protein
MEAVYVYAFNYHKEKPDIMRFTNMEELEAQRDKLNDEQFARAAKMLTMTDDEWNNKGE